MHQALWVDRAKRCRQHNTAAEKVAVTCWGMCPRPCQKMHAHQRGEVTTTHVLLQQVHYWGQARTHTRTSTHCASRWHLLQVPRAKSKSYEQHGSSSKPQLSSKRGPFFSWQGNRNTRAYHGTTLLLSASRLIHTQPKSCSGGFGGAADAALLYNLKKREGHTATLGTSSTAPHNTSNRRHQAAAAPATH